MKTAARIVQIEAFKTRLSVLKKADKKRYTRSFRRVSYPLNIVEIEGAISYLSFHLDGHSWMWRSVSESTEKKLTTLESEQL